MRVSSSTFFLLFNSLLAALASYMGGSLLGTWLQQELLYLPVPPSRRARIETVKPPQDSGKARNEFEVILARNIFQAQKNEPVLPPSPPETDTPAPETTPEEQTVEHTRLALALAGTMIYSEENAFAFISKKERLHEYIIYEIGDCFNAKTIQHDQNCAPESVKVLEIKDRWILILHRGKRQALWMISETTARETTTPAKQVRQPPKTAPQPKTTALIVPPKIAVAPQKPEKPEAPEDGQNTFHFQRVWVEEQLENFQQLLDDARVVSTTKNEKPYFMFQFIKEGSIYEKLGLKKNDIILEINGFIVDTLGKALKLLETLQSEREIMLKVEREGNPLQFHYYID